MISRTFDFLDIKYPSLFRHVHRHPRGEIYYLAPRVLCNRIAVADSMGSSDPVPEVPPVGG